ncbi:MAG: ABC transporter permease [Clostridia bacterium]|nr:ABC transporter permease [Clostridia bacterium]
MEKTKTPKLLTRLKEFFTKKSLSFKKNANIVRELVKKNVKIQYRNSVIGAIWTVLNPLLNMLVMYFVFSNVLGYHNDRTYALYLLCGTITFALMRAGTTQSMTSLVRNRGLLTKNKISYFVFPVSNNLVALINFSFSLIALIAVMLFVAFFNNVFEIFSANLLLILAMLPALFLFSYGLSLILSALYVFFRDVQHFYNVFLTLWTYLTPMFYKIDRFANKDELSAKVITGVINLNPMYHFVEFFRDVTYRCAEYTVVLEKCNEDATYLASLAKDYGMSIEETLSVVQNYASLPNATEYLVLYAWGIGAFLLGTLIFLLTRRKFIFYI